MCSFIYVGKSNEIYSVVIPKDLSDNNDTNMLL